MILIHRQQKLLSRMNIFNQKSVQFHVRFLVLTAASIQIRAFWHVELCSLRVDQSSRGAYCLPLRPHSTTSEKALIFSSVSKNNKLTRSMKNITDTRSDGSTTG
jgi:hypothetical protein